MRRYQGDPYWLYLKWPGTCRRCGQTIPKERKAFRFKDGSLYCEADPCGPTESRRFEAAAFDEAQYTRDW